MGRVAKYVFLHLDIKRVSQIDVAVIAKIHDIKELLARVVSNPMLSSPNSRGWQRATQWQTREVAATALVEIGKRHPVAVLDTARRWAKDRDANVRRAASEGLRGVVKVDPQAVRPVLETLRTDPELYVKKSVANVLRNASGKHPELVLSICRHWSRSSNPHTGWIVKEGLGKLKGSRPRDVAAILKTLDKSY